MALGTVVSIAAPADAQEPPSATLTYRFTLTRSGDTTGASSVDWLKSGTTSAADFAPGQAFDGTVSFIAGQTTAYIDFLVKADALTEATETIDVTLSNPVGCVIVGGLGGYAIAVDTDGSVTLTPPASATPGTHAEFEYEIADDFDQTASSAVTINVISPGAATYANGYEQKANTYIGPDSEAMTGFPVYFDFQHPALRTQINGGAVRAQYQDVRLEDGAGNKLSHGLLFHDVVIGRIQGIYRRSRSASAWNAVEVYCGRQAGAVDEQDWAGATAGHHFFCRGDTGVDLTGNGRHLTPTSVAATTLFGYPAGQFNGTTSKLELANPSAWLNGTSAYTLLLDLQVDQIATDAGFFRTGGTVTGKDVDCSMMARTDAALLADPSKTRLWFARQDTDISAVTTNCPLNGQDQTIRTSEAQCFAMAWASGEAQDFYTDDSADAEIAKGVATPTGTLVVPGGPLAFGAGPRQAFTGKLGLVRMASTRRSDAWIKAEQRNRLNPLLMIAAGAFRAPAATAPPVAFPDTAEMVQSSVSTANYLLNPFSAASHHHMPIGDGATYANTADAAYVDLQRAAGFVSLNSNNGYGKNVFQASVSDPLKTIAWNGDENGYGLGGTGPANPGNIRFPANALITNLNPAAVDRGIAIVAPDGRTVYELRGYNNNASAPQASGLKIWDASGLGYDPGTARWGFSASGVGCLFGLLRGFEFNDTAIAIQHVLQLALSYNASTAWTQDHGGPILQGDYIAPANGVDSRCNTDAASCTGNVKYGSRWAIPPVSKGGPNLTTLGLTAREMQLAVCLRDFGTMVIDGTDSAAMRCDQGWNSGVITAVRDAMRTLWPRLRRITNSTTTTNNVIGGGASIGGLNSAASAAAGFVDLYPTENDTGTGISIVSASVDSSKGAVVVTGPTSIRFTPKLSTTGVVYVTYAIKDALNRQSTSIITVTIVPATVTARPDTYTVSASAMTELAVLANDSPAGLIEVDAIAVQGTKGTAVASADKTKVEYTAGAVTGADSFTYRGKIIGGSATGTATVALTITAPASFPARLYQPMHRPLVEADIEVFRIGIDTSFQHNDWSRYLLLVWPDAIFTGTCNFDNLRYKGVFEVGGHYGPIGTVDKWRNSGTTKVQPALKGEGGMLQRSFADPPLAHRTPTSRVFWWCDGLLIDTCSQTGDVLGRTQSCWWGDFWKTGVVRTSDGLYVDRASDAFIQRTDILNSNYFFSEWTGSAGGGQACHSDWLQNESLCMRSLNVWMFHGQCNGQGFYVTPDQSFDTATGLPRGKAPRDGFIEMSYCHFEPMPWDPVSDKFPSITDLKYVALAQKNSTNANDTTATFTDSAGNTHNVPAAYYWGLYVGPEVYLQETADGCTGNPTQLLGKPYNTTASYTRNATARTYTWTVDKRCFDASLHDYYVLGATGGAGTGLGGMWGRAAGWLKRSASIDAPSYQMVPTAARGRSRRITTAAGLLAYLDSGL